VIYLLDTNAISALMRADIRMAAWLSSIGTNDHLAMCTISRGEILFGLEKLVPGRRRTELEGKAGKLFAICRVSRSSRPPLIGTRMKRLLNSAVA
jgi:predicted nucleic acid-binding protein